MYIYSTQSNLFTNKIKRFESSFKKHKIILSVCTVYVCEMRERKMPWPNLESEGALELSLIVGHLLPF